jgi:hypothetical protein
MIGIPSEIIAQTLPFSLLPQHETLMFRSIDHDNFVILEGRNGDERNICAVQTIIRKEEADIWHACNQMVQFHLGQSKDMIKGSFTFELIAVEMFEGLCLSDWTHLHTVIMKSAAKLTPGGTQLVTYRSLRGILTMRTPLDWGKMVTTHAVRVMSHPAEKIDLYIKKLLKRTENRYIVIHDISREPLLDPTNEEQTIRCRKLLSRPDGPESTKPIIIYAHRLQNCIVTDRYAQSE